MKTSKASSWSGASLSAAPCHTNILALISTSSHFKRTGKPHHVSYCLRLPCCAVQVSELSSELETKQQEVVSLQKSLAAAQQEKDTVEHTLASLVRGSGRLTSRCSSDLNVIVVEHI